MKLHRLEVTAFGPFGSTEEIEFEKLDDAGLFLLTGATGSGKTSVLDAICFALYGLVPRSESSKPDVASHYRAEDASPSVTLELTMGDRRLRIERAPEYERPKKNGTGVTTEKQTVTLEQQTPESPEWKLVSSTWTEANNELKDMLGMDLNQFSQVVMLPQGSFARFLRADVKHRRELLNHLFPSQKMDYIERWLKDRSKADVAARDEQEQQIRSQLDKAAGRLTGLLGEDDEPLSDYPHESDREEVLSWVGTVQKRLEADRDSAAKAEADSAKDLKQAVGEHESLTARAALVVKRAESEDRLKQLEIRTGERKALAESISAAEKAAGVRGLIESFESRQQKFLEASEETASLLASLEADEEIDGTDRSELVAQEKTLRSKVTILTSFQNEDLSRRSDLQVRLAKVEADLSASIIERDGATEASKSGPADLKTLNEEKQDALSAKAGIADARKLASESAERFEAAKIRDALDPKLAQAEELLEELTGTATHAATELVHIRKLRTDGMAAELAAGLEEGEPCVVCGSTEHPSPQEAAEDAPTREAEEAADSALALARSAVEDARNSRDRVKSEREEFDVKAGRLTTVEIGEKTEQLTAALTDREDRASQADRIEREIAELNEVIGGASAAISKAGTRITKLEGELSATAAELAKIITREESLLEGAATIGERRDRLDLLADRVALALSRQLDSENCRVASDTAETEALAKAESSGFENLQQATAAMLDPSELERIKGEAASFDSDLAVAREALADDELKDVDRSEKVPLGDAAAKRKVAEEAHKALAAALTTMSDRFTGFSEQTAPLPVLFDELTPLTEAADRSRGLNALASGKNSRKMELSIYVLAARLKQVIEAANTHLGPMSNDRFQLVYSGDLIGGGAISGLGIQVFDAHTSKTRETITLSGGESFYASLSLALGLAEIVQQESGGKSLETLFIDEGFGTLDSDTLDQVMNVIDDLRADGRTVGLVSHVEELRNRIPTQIQVTGGSEGSHLEVSGV